MAAAPSSAALPEARGGIAPSSGRLPADRRSGRPGGTTRSEEGGGKGGRQGRETDREVAGRRP